MIGSSKNVAVNCTVAIESKSRQIDKHVVCSIAISRVLRWRLACNVCDYRKRLIEGMHLVAFSRPMQSNDAAKNILDLVSNASQLGATS